MTKSVHCSLAILCFITMGAGPVYYEPAAYTGDAIQKAIDSAYRDIRGRVFLPGGVYRINKTILLNGLGPMIIDGAATGSIWRETDHASTVRLEWYGPKGQPMIRMNSLGVLIQNILLDGRDSASHGVLLTNSPKSGSASNRLADVTLAHFTTACFQAGEKPNDGCCADMYFDRVNFFSAPQGFLSVNDQSVNNYFTGCQFGYLGTALNIDRGGAVSVIDCSGSACDLILRVIHGGHNTGPIHIGPMKLERSGYKNKYMSLIDARADPIGNNAGVDAGQIRLVSVRMADTSYPNVPDTVETPLFRLGPGAQVVAEGCSFEQEGDTLQWPFGILVGKKDHGMASLRSRDTIWFGNLATFSANEFSVLELQSPPTRNGVLTPTIKRGILP